MKKVLFVGQDPDTVARRGGRLSTPKAACCAREACLYTRR
jgi:hypothetical protein